MVSNSYRALAFASALLLVTGCGSGGAQTGSGTDNLASKPAGSSGGSAPNRGGPYKATTDDAVDVLRFSTTDSKAFDVTPTSRDTGLITTAHPNQYSVTWQSISQGKVFGVNFASGEVDSTPCADITVHAGGVVLFNTDKDNTCGLQPEYDVDSFRDDAKDKVVEFGGGGVTLTPVDPATGLINVAHPDEYVLKWTADTSADVFEANFATGEPAANRCGTLSVDPTTSKLAVNGCNDLGGNYTHPATPGDGSATSK